jgi:hypothetical protein
MLKKVTPVGVGLDLSTLWLSGVEILIEQQGIRLNVTASGGALLGTD